MSYRVFFSFSTGLARPLMVPSGTLAAINQHVTEVEAALSIKRTRYESNPEHWDYDEGFPSVSDEVLCKTAEEHNAWVRDLYEDFGKWSNQPVTDGEEISIEAAAAFWPALRQIDVDPSRWTRDYYRARMEHLYEVMRGRPSEGVSFNSKRFLTPEQAAAVICLFSFLDPDDLRLDVPHGRDYLASSYDGGYSWCDKCFRAIAEDDTSCRRRKCPILEEMS